MALLKDWWRSSKRIYGNGTGECEALSSFRETTPLVKHKLKLMTESQSVKVKLKTCSDISLISSVNLKVLN